MATNRDIWMPDFQTTVIEIVGQEWPNILVEKWERNLIGERRLVTTLIYPAPKAESLRGAAVKIGEAMG